MNDKPTPAAMRAADTVSPFQTDAYKLAEARLIDEATGLPELIAALERARQCLHEFRSGYFAREIEAIDEALRIALEGRS